LLLTIFSRKRSIFITFQLSSLQERFLPDLSFQHLFINTTVHVCYMYYFHQRMSLLWSYATFDPSVSFIKGWRLNNKQFSIDYFLEREGQHWVSTFAPTLTPYQIKALNLLISKPRCTGQAWKNSSVGIGPFFDIHSRSLIITPDHSTALTTICTRCAFSKHLLWFLHKQTQIINLHLLIALAITVVFLRSLLCCVAKPSLSLFWGVTALMPLQPLYFLLKFNLLS